MYFDDIYMEDMEPATRVSEYTARIVDFCMEDQPHRKENLLSFAFWIIFSFPIPPSITGKLPLRCFYLKNCQILTKKIEKSILHLDSIFTVRLRY